MGHLQRKGESISLAHSSRMRNMVCSTLHHLPGEYVLWTLQIRFTALVWGENYVCFLCYPHLQFMSYSEEVEAEYRHLIYCIVMYSDEQVINTH